MKRFITSLTIKQKIRIIIFFFSCILIIPIFSLFFGLLMASAGFFDSSESPMPTFEILENPPTNLATEIISSDGVVLGTYYLENRRKVRYDQISKNVIDASISNLTTLKVNTEAANSRIQDADFAIETANLTRTQILQQAGIAILAQANAIPQQVLSLLSK